MEVRDFAESVLFSPDLEKKLRWVDNLTDEQPDPPLEQANLNFCREFAA